MDGKPHPEKSHWAGHIAVAALSALAVLGVRQALAARSVDEEKAAASAVTTESRHTPQRDTQPPLDLTGLDDKALARLMEDQPMRVMAAIDRMENREEALRLTILCTHAVAGPDFDLLVAWARREKNPRIAAAIFTELMPRWSHEDLAGCLSFAHDLGGGADAMVAKDALLRRLPGRLSVEMLAQVPTEQRAQLLKQRSERLAVTNPEGAFDLIVKLPATGTRSEALSGLIGKWAGGTDIEHVADPVAAVHRVQQISDASLRSEGLRAASAAWCRVNAPGAGRWAENLPAGPDRDAAIQGMVQFFATRDADRALTWAQEIGDSTLRDEALEKLQPQ